MAKTDFSQGSIKRLIISQALPLTLAQAVQLLYNVVDRVYIGHLEGIGDLALPGLGITFPVIVLINAFTSLYGSGGATLFAIARGQRDEREAEAILGNVFALLVSTALVLMAFCYGLRRPILFLFGASEQSFFYADQYLGIYLLGTVCSMTTAGLNSYINAQGFPQVGMLTTILGAVMNIILDPIFIFAMNMGVRGAALATILSQAVSALWVLRFLTGRKAILKLRRANIRVRWSRTRKILALGIPGFVMQGTNSLVAIMCNNQLQAYGGDLYVGIMTVVSSVREMLSLPTSGIAQGGQAVMGFNYGAKEYDRVKETIRFITILGFAATFVGWVLVMAFPGQLMGIFSDDPETIRIGARMLNIQFFGFVFMSFQFGGQCTFQALGRAKQAVFFAIFRKAIIVVPLTLLLPAVGLGVEGVFMAEPVSNFVGGVTCFTTMYLTLYRKLGKKA